MTSINSSVNSLMDLVQNSPQGEKIGEMVDHFFWQIHSDENINVITDLVKAYLSQNKNLFSQSKYSVEDAILIFDAYRKAYLTSVFKEIKFQSAFQETKGQAEFSSLKPTIVEAAVHTLILERIKIFHSAVIGIVLEKSLSLPEGSLKFHALPDSYTDRNSNLSMFSEFFESHFSEV